MKASGKLFGQMHGIAHTAAITENYQLSASLEYLSHLSGQALDFRLLVPIVQQVVQQAAGF
jgi:hypothetical protein